MTTTPNLEIDGLSLLSVDSDIGIATFAADVITLPQQADACDAFAPVATDSPA